MPVTGPSSYVATIVLFLTHWNDTNDELGAGGPLILPGGTTRQMLSDWHDELVAFAASIQDKINDREIARGTIDLLKQSLLGRLGEFNRKVRGFLSHTAYAKALPDAPTENAGEARILAPLDDAASLWATINAATIPGFTGPLLLLNGYGVATFNTELVSLKAAYKAYQVADQSLRLAREQRNEVQVLAYVAMRDYRAAVIGSFPPGHALIESLPPITPSSGGGDEPEEPEEPEEPGEPEPPVEP